MEFRKNTGSCKNFSSKLENKTCMSHETFSFVIFFNPNNSDLYLNPYVFDYITIEIIEITINDLRDLQVKQLP